MAIRENVSIHALGAILPKLLKGIADKWYWVFVSKCPSASYLQIKDALLQRFSSYETERATRREIETRKQRHREPISEFVLEIEGLNSRLTNSFSEQELLEIVRENMCLELQQATLTTNIHTVEGLRLICQKYERLWLQNQGPKPNFNYINQRRFNQIHEISSEFDPESTLQPPEYDYQGNYEDMTKRMQDTFEIEAVQQSRLQQHRQIKTNYDKLPEPHLICWNCRDIGHRYQDCRIPPQHIFCYGCGKSDVIKPQCPNCNKITSGNATPGVMNSGVSRPVQISAPQNQNQPIPRNQVLTRRH